MAPVLGAALSPLLGLLVTREGALLGRQRLQRAGLDFGALLGTPCSRKGLRDGLDRGGQAGQAGTSPSCQRTPGVGCWPHGRPVPRCWDRPREEQAEVRQEMPPADLQRG